MAKLQHLLISLCLLSTLFKVALAKGSHFTVMGQVYCDTCRVGFRTEISEVVEGAKVKVECKRQENGEVAYEKETTTDGKGIYKMKIDNDNKDEHCEVVLLESPMDGCNEIQTGKDRASITFTKNGHMQLETYIANALSFYKKDPLPTCSDLLRSYDSDEE